MSPSTRSGATLGIRQLSPANGRIPIHLRLRGPGRPDLAAATTIDFALSTQEEADLRWYLEDYLQHPDAIAAVQVEQIEAMMGTRGEDYTKVLAANRDTQAIWLAVREQLAELRIEIGSAPTAAAGAAICSSSTPRVSARCARSQVPPSAACCTTPGSPYWCSTPANPPCTK